MNTSNEFRYRFISRSLRLSSTVALLGVIACGAQGGADETDQTNEVLADGNSGLAESAASSDPQTDLNAASETGKNCVIVVSKAARGELSRVLSKTCSTDPNAASLSSAAGTKVLLMEWLENANNDPPGLTRVYGYDGECDADGYRLRVGFPWFIMISGFVAYSRCNVVTAYSQQNISGDRQTWSGKGLPCECVSARWVGPYMNDRIQSWWIRHE